MTSGLNTARYCLPASLLAEELLFIPAGAVVTKDVDLYTIVAGNPAHKVSVRFEGDVIKENEAAWSAVDSSHQ